MRSAQFTLALGLLLAAADALVLPPLDIRFGRFGSSTVFCFVALVLGTLCWIIIRDRPTRSFSHSEQEPSNAWSGAADSISTTLAQPRLWLAALHGGLFFAIVGAFGGLWGGPFLRARLDVSFEEATRLLSVLFLSGAIGAPILGLIATRVRWRGSILIVASVGCAVFSSLLILAELPRSAVMSLLFGLGFFTAGFALDLAYVRDLVTERMQGFALGTANLILGIVAGPLMLMLIAESLERTGLEGTVTASNASIEPRRGCGCGPECSASSPAPRRETGTPSGSIWPLAPASSSSGAGSSPLSSIRSRQKRIECSQDVPHVGKLARITSLPRNGGMIWKASCPSSSK